MRDLNDLSFFAAVVAHGGFSAAARALGLPKSRLSRRVAALEAQLGVRLVERSTRRFKVTEVGAEVYGHARAAMLEAEAVEEAVSRLRAEPRGLVRVSCPLGLDRLLAAAMPELLERHPRLRLQVLVGNRRVDLIEEGVDVAIRVREQLDSDADLQVKVIARTGLQLAASPAFLTAHGVPVEPASLAGFPTLSHTDRPGADRWRLTSTAGETIEVVHEPRLSANAFPILRQAAIAGLGVALLPEYLCREPFAEGSLVPLLSDWRLPQGLLHLVFTSRRGQLPAVRAVIDFVAEVLHPRSPVWEIAP